MELFRLYGFTDGRVEVYSRARNEDEAWEYIKRSNSFQRGVTIRMMNYLPLFVKEAYGENHPFDWLHTPMKWLKESLTLS